MYGRKLITVKARKGVSVFKARLRIVDAATAFAVIFYREKRRQKQKKVSEIIMIIRLVTVYQYLRDSEPCYASLSLVAPDSVS